MQSGSISRVNLVHVAVQKDIKPLISPLIRYKYTDIQTRLFNQFVHDHDESTFDHITFAQDDLCCWRGHDNFWFSILLSHMLFMLDLRSCKFHRNNHSFARLHFDFVLFNMVTCTELRFKVGRPVSNIPFQAPG